MKAATFNGWCEITTGQNFLCLMPQYLINNKMNFKITTNETFVTYYYKIKTMSKGTMFCKNPITHFSDDIYELYVSIMYHIIIIYRNMFHPINMQHHNHNLNVYKTVMKLQPNPAQFSKF